MCIDMCIDMCIGMGMDMCIDMGMDMCIDICMTNCRLLKVKQEVADNDVVMRDVIGQVPVL